jgi:hypothetical protein
MNAYIDSRSGARQTPTHFSCGEAEPQVGVILFSGPRFVHVATHHIKEFPYQASLRPVPTKPVVHPATVPPGLHETRSAEAAQMPRNLVLRHAERIHELADTELLLTQQPQ